MKIIVIGAGISGLTLALACQRAGMQVRVYEKTKKLRTIGGGLLLWPHGIRYLEWLGLSACVTPYQPSIKRCRMVGTDGSTIFSEEYADFYRLMDGEILPIDRSLLQQNLASMLADNTLMLGKRCVDVKSHADKADVFFADGTSDSADLVIGADGIHSAVRQHINTGDLAYTNYCWWGGMIDQSEVPELATDETFIAMGVGKMCIAWPAHGRKFMWYLPVKMTTDAFVPEGSGLTQLHDICSGWHPVVEKIINAPSGTQRFHLPIYTLLPQASWSTSRTTLIGDSAHALGPILGQGANLAIEDAYVLSRCLQQHPKNIHVAVQKYESFRHARTERFYQLEADSTAAMVNEDIETLMAFQQEIRQLKLATLYQDLIPLVNEKACEELDAMVSGKIEVAAA